MPNDLESAINALLAKQDRYNTLWQYYLGAQPVVYTNERLREIFRNVDASFTENWAALVVDAVQDRLKLKGVTVAGLDDAQEQVDAVFGNLGLELIAEDVHEATLITGESYLIVWPDEQGEVQGYFNDPRMCHVFYDSRNPYLTRYAVKWYNTDDGFVEAILYYADHLEYYRTRAKATPDSSLTYKSFDQTDLQDNPYDQAPMFCFKLHREPRSELINVVPLQNGVNKLLIDMMVAAEFGAFRQRWIISNSDTEKLKNAPNEIWSIPAGDGVGQSTQVGDFQPTDLGNYLTAIDKLASAIGVITRTPKHYFFTQGGDPSGEALIAMEAPLNKKASDYIARLTSTWRPALAFALKLLGTEVKPSDITLRYERPETVQPLTQSIVRQNSVTAGIPLVTTLRREGWTDAEIEEMEAEKGDEQAEQTATLGAALAKAQRTFDQGGNGQAPPREEPVANASAK